MKRILSLFFILFVFNTTSCEQEDSLFSGICEGDYYIINKNNLDSISNCREITGSIEIIGTSLTNLNILRDLVSVGGFVWIWYNPSLKSLQGLDNLEFVEGGLWIEHNHSLANLEGLRNITFVGGGVHIKNNFSLTNLEGLSNLTSVDGVFSIVNNDALKNLKGLRKLYSIGGGVTISDNINLPTCEANNFVKQLINFTGKSDIFGNDDLGTCE